jgi:hypothetical protein
MILIPLGHRIDGSLRRQSSSIPRVFVEQPNAAAPNGAAAQDPLTYR